MESSSNTPNGLKEVTGFVPKDTHLLKYKLVVHDSEIFYQEQLTKLGKLTSNFVSGLDVAEGGVKRYPRLAAMTVVGGIAVVAILSGRPIDIEVQQDKIKMHLGSATEVTNGLTATASATQKTSY